MLQEAQVWRDVCDVWCDDVGPSVTAACVGTPVGCLQVSHGSYIDSWSAVEAHRITSSARIRRVGGIVIPSAWAVLRLRTSSYFVGCSTGRAAGLAPFRILSTYVAARRNISGKFGP